MPVSIVLKQSWQAPTRSDPSEATMCSTVRMSNGAFPAFAAYRVYSSGYRAFTAKPNQGHGSTLVPCLVCYYLEECLGALKSI